MYNHSHQRPDYFLFISLERDRANKTKDVRRFHKAYILGAISYDEIDKVGIPFLEGEADWRNGTTFWTDCLNVEMWQLIKLNETVEILKGHQSGPATQAQLNYKILNEMKVRIKNGTLKDRKLPVYENY